MRKIVSVLVLGFIALFISAGGASMQQTKASQLKNEDLKAVAGKKIFFGHQSVGFNILDGINAIYGENGVKLNVVKSKDASVFKGPAFAHSQVGHNDSPESKIEDFGTFMRNGLGGKADIAFFKLCYVDIIYSSDVDGLFRKYKETLGQLKKEYPRTRFVHVTVPLTTSASPIKGFIKSLMGRHDSNIKRQLFNEKLRKEYSGKEPLFDLAAIESTRPDGTRASFQKSGSTYYSLSAEYTDDGGHLNELGKKTVAAELIRLLAAL